MRTDALYIVSLVFPRGSICVIPDRPRFTFDLAVGAFWTTTNIAHVALLARTDRPIVMEGGHSALVMEATDL